MEVGTPVNGLLQEGAQEQWWTRTAKGSENGGIRCQKYL